MELDSLADKLVGRRYRATHVCNATIAKCAQPLAVPRFPSV